MDEERFEEEISEGEEIQDEERTIEEMSEALKIESTTDGRLIINVMKRVNTVSAPALQLAIDGLISSGNEKIVLDFSDTEYISSAGLRVILYTRKALDEIEGGALEIVNVNDSVKEIFELTGFEVFE
jgi:anti-sigma B factor antagonist